MKTNTGRGPLPPLILLLAIVVGLLLVGWGYLHFVRDPWVRKVAALENSKDSLNTALIEHDVRERQRAFRDSTLSRHVVTVRVRVDTVLVRATVAESVFVGTLPDSLKAPFLTVVALKDSAIAGLKLIISDQAQQIALRDTSLAETRAALFEALRQRDAYRKEAKPNFVIRIFRNLPLIAGSVGAGVVLGVVTSP